MAPPRYPPSVPVLLPGPKDGRGPLKESPGFEWERIGEVNGQLFRSLRGTGEVRLLLKNASTEERAEIHAAGESVALPPNTLWMHDYRGDFGVHTPGIAATADGAVLVATGIRRHDSNSDGGHDGDILTAYSLDSGASWSKQAVAYAEPGVLFYMGPITAAARGGGNVEFTGLTQTLQVGPAV